uniref:Uncharacterized protein n=1 Tax=Anguilla anguilla TaxID=7936 RepID=A0A0E9T452_ANGAN
MYSSCLSSLCASRRASCL